MLPKEWSDKTVVPILSGSVVVVAAAVGGGGESMVSSVLLKKQLCELTCCLRSTFPNRLRTRIGPWTGYWGPRR